MTTKKILKMVMKVFPGTSIIENKQISPSEAGRILSQHKKVIKKSKNNNSNKDQLSLF